MKLTQNIQPILPLHVLLSRLLGFPWISQIELQPHYFRARAFLAQPLVMQGLDGVFRSLFTSRCEIDLGIVRQ